MLDDCVDLVILAPTDPTDTTEDFETAITGGDKFNDLGGAGNEVNIASLLKTMQESVGELGCDCANNTCTHKPCTRNALVNYISRHVSDLDRDGRVTCDDAAILLYVGHEFTSPDPVTIRCSFFLVNIQAQCGLFETQHRT